MLKCESMMMVGIMAASAVSGAAIIVMVQIIFHRLRNGSHMMD